MTHDQAPPSCDATFGRHLLRRLRDLNLQEERVGVNTDTIIRFQGCVSKDAPVENGVLYSLSDGRERHLLELSWQGAGLEIRLDGQARTTEFVSANQDQVQARELRTRLGAKPDAQDLRRLLRRVVRYAWAA